MKSEIVQLKTLYSHNIQLDIPEKVKQKLDNIQNQQKTNSLKIMHFKEEQIFLCSSFVFNIMNNFHFIHPSFKIFPELIYYTLIIYKYWPTIRNYWNFQEFPRISEEIRANRGIIIPNHLLTS